MLEQTLIIKNYPHYRLNQVVDFTYIQHDFGDKYVSTYKVNRGNRETMDINIRYAQWSWEIFAKTLITVTTNLTLKLIHIIFEI